MPAAFSEGLSFSDGRDELPRWVQHVRETEKVDVVVLLSHLGLPQDLDLLDSIPGVDVCLSSHTHNRLSTPIRAGNTLVIQSGCHGSFLGKLHLRIDEDGSIALVEHALIEVSALIAEDDQLRRLTGEALAPFRTELSVVAGRTPVALNRATMLASTADDMLLDSMLECTGAEIAFANGWRYGAPVPVGDVTVNDLYNLAPMDPEIMLVELTGAEVWAMIEENLERTFSRKAFGQMGGFIKRCAGMVTFFKVENPKGSRVQQIFVGDRPLEPERRYKSAYITMQAVPDKYGRDRQHSGIKLIDAAKRRLSGDCTQKHCASFVEV